MLVRLILFQFELLEKRLLRKLPDVISEKANVSTHCLFRPIWLSGQDSR